MRERVGGLQKLPNRGKVVGVEKLSGLSTVVE